MLTFHEKILLRMQISGIHESSGELHRVFQIVQPILTNLELNEWFSQFVGVTAKYDIERAKMG